MCEKSELKVEMHMENAETYTKLGMHNLALNELKILISYLQALKDENIISYQKFLEYLTEVTKIMKGSAKNKNVKAEKCAEAGRLPEATI